MSQELQQRPKGSTRPSERTRRWPTVLMRGWLGCERWARLGIQRGRRLFMGRPKLIACVAIVGYAAAMGLLLRHSLTQRPPIPGHGFENSSGYGLGDGIRPESAGAAVSGSEKGDGLARAAHPRRTFGVRIVPNGENGSAGASSAPIGATEVGAARRGSAGVGPGARPGARLGVQVGVRDGDPPPSSAPFAHPWAHQGEFVDDLSVIAPSMAVRAYEM